ncbi:MAG: hypothetical protein F2864_03275 [Actinobacteria bacterium]|nr:hypothetical protein [Actinomycetota bacterium]
MPDSGACLDWQLGLADLGGSFGWQLWVAGSGGSFQQICINPDDSGR